MPEEPTVTEEVAEGEVSVEDTGVDEAQAETSEEESVEIGNVSLDDITDPQSRQFAKQLQGSYTQGMQANAEQRKAMEAREKALSSYGETLQQQAAELEKGKASTVAPLDWDNASNEDISNWVLQGIRTEVDQAVAPVQEQFNVINYGREVDRLKDSRELFKEMLDTPEGQAKAADIASHGLTVETVLKAMAFDDMETKLSQQAKDKTKAKATLAGQTQTTATTTPTTEPPKKLGVSEAVASVLADIKSGKLDFPAH